MNNKIVSKKRLTLLVLRAQAGDREAMDRLLEAYQDQLFRFLMNMLQDHADAEDALQATLLQAVKKLRWVRKPEYFRSWAFRIASRIAFRIIKKRRRRKEFTNAAFVDEVFDPELDNSETMSLVEQIPKWLDRLTPNGQKRSCCITWKGLRQKKSPKSSTSPWEQPNRELVTHLPAFVNKSLARKDESMTSKNNLNRIRGETLNSMARNELWFKLMLGICGIAEVVGLIVVFWLINWSDPTHRLIFAATMLVGINLFLWVYTLAVRNRVGEQRILRAIDVLAENTNGENER